MTAEILSKADQTERYLFPFYVYKNYDNLLRFGSFLLI